MSDQARADFANLYRHGFARIAACTLPVQQVDPFANASAIATMVRELDAKGVALAVFPELSLSGYAIDDLFLQDVLLRDVEGAIGALADETADLLPVVVVGAPLRHGNRLFNCAVVIHRGVVLGISPKSYVPTYREFYERRHFAPGDDQRSGDREPNDFTFGPSAGSLAGDLVPFGPDLIFAAEDLPDLRIHVEVCEDLWVPIPPSSQAALAGATVLVNLSGSPITVAKADKRHLLCRAQSTTCLAAYVYAAAGEGESSTDLSWDGQTMIYETGTLLAESERFPAGPRSSIADVDLGGLIQERLRQGTFDDCRRAHDEQVRGFRVEGFVLDAPTGDLGLMRQVDRFPFVPDDPERLAQDCYEAYNIQVSGLEQRLRAIATDTWSPKIVIGVSGGLDSTQALLVAAKAMDRLERPRTDIIAITMPGFATSAHTKSNATELSQRLGVTFEEIDIRPAALQMLKDMGHPFGLDPDADHDRSVYDVTFENVQAGLRTDYLFRIANQRGGLVLGTGDLSELALGWCTYGVGDQMSHYAVNTGVPKTLMQHLIRWVISSGQYDSATGDVLASILDTEITPELVPTTGDEKPQSTEGTIGPYALHDFTLHHVLRRGTRPATIAFLAEHAWAHAEQGEWPPGFPQDSRPEYDLPAIRHWLEVFVRRFFANQFKRSALPNGPKVLSGGTLSPRGDWRMPSDAVGTRWLADIEDNVPTS
ncbi:NAD(+) synthase [Janibacter sp. GXQ6167]|uniref:NAD(+) synthase n=1 Tax=Janibacter sp. GXQ6167 TaxID=3240791 RepID=UPI00352696C9